MQSKPTNEVILKLPFRKGGFFSITLKRKVGFVFDNHVAHAVYINSNAKNAEEFKAWGELENGAVRNFEFLFCAAVRYGELTRKPDNFTRNELKKALAEADKDQAKLLADCVRRSEMYGATYKKKHKAVKN